MMIKTHLAITAFFILLFFPLVEYKTAFVIVALIATFIPDIDSRFSTIGKNKINRLFQWLTKHRGVIHSFTFLMVLTLLLVLFIPILSLGFFLGYGVHLLADSFTLNGIRPFWPSKMSISGRLSTGRKLEKALFFTFIITDLLLLITRFSV